MIGPQTSIRPRSSSRIASARSQVFLRTDLGRGSMSRLEHALRINGLQHRKLLRGRPKTFIRQADSRDCVAPLSACDRVRSANCSGRRVADFQCHHRATSRRSLNFLLASSPRAASARHAIHLRLLLQATLLFRLFQLQQRRECRAHRSHFVRKRAACKRPESGVLPAARYPKTRTAAHLKSHEASGEGSGRSRAMQRISPCSILRRTSSRPSMSIASVRQSSIVCLTSG